MAASSSFLKFGEMTAIPIPVKFGEMTAIPISSSCAAMAAPPPTTLATKTATCPSTSAARDLDAASLRCRKCQGTRIMAASCDMSEQDIYRFLMEMDYADKKNPVRYEWKLVVDALNAFQLKVVSIDDYTDQDILAMLERMREGLVNSIHDQSSGLIKVACHLLVLIAQFRTPLFVEADNAAVLCVWMRSRRSRSCWRSGLSRCLRSSLRPYAW